MKCRQGAPHYRYVRGRIVTHTRNVNEIISVATGYICYLRRANKQINVNTTDSRYQSKRQGSREDDHGRAI